MMDALERTLAQAEQELRELVTTPERPSEEAFLRVWAHLAGVVQVLAVLEHVSPREVCEEAFTFAPTKEEWQAILERAAVDALP